MIRFALTLAVLLAASVPARAAVDIVEVTSPGGLKAWLVEEHSIPFTALELRFKGGASLEAPGKRGAINLMTGLLEEGAANMDAQAFAKARESLAASYGFDVYDDSMAISARFLTENRDEAIALLRAALVAPRFDPDAIERVRAQVLSGIASDSTDPGHIASSTFDALAFGDHPYGADRSGTAESVAALTRDDLTEAHARLLTRDRLVIGAVGDITPEALGSLLDDLLGDLPATSDAAVPEANFALSEGVTVIDFDTPQSIAYFGHSGIKRDDPDFFAAFVANEIFGGSGFGSRLTEEVREKRGLTYGIGSFMVGLDQAQMVLGQAATANERMAETIEVVRDEWRRISEAGVTQEELDAAVKFLTGAYPLRFDGNATIARILAGMQMDDLGIDYIATRNDKVSAVTLEDIARVVKRIYRPEDLHFVVVGKPVGLDEVN
ncbi:MAG: insulinase family protein [Rhodobacteraceae bacterium]|nr:insulinase family protein [Paracoccaceae bacterium]